MKTFANWLKKKLNEENLGVTQIKWLNPISKNNTVEQVIMTKPSGAFGVLYQNTSRIQLTFQPIDGTRVRVKAGDEVIDVVKLSHSLGLVASHLEMKYANTGASIHIE